MSRIAAVLLVVLALAHTGAWWLVTIRIEQQLPAAFAEAAASGWRLESGPSVRAGWPWMATVRLPLVTATRVLGSPGIRWTAEQVDVSLAPLSPTMLRLAPSGAQTFNFSGRPAVPFHAAHILARIPLTGGPIEIGADALAIGDPTAGATVAALTGALGPQRMVVHAVGIAVMPPLEAPLDGPIDLTATFASSAPFPGALSPGPLTPSQSATAWRDAGGRVELTALSVHWGKLVLEGSGTGGLDAQLQPEGHLVFHVEGAVEAIDAMARAGLILPGPAAAARAVLGLLVVAARGGPVTLPVALSGRVLTVTQFPILKLPVLDWNAP